MMQHGTPSAGTARRPTCLDRTPPHEPRTAEQTAWSAPRIPTATFPRSQGGDALQNRRSGAPQQPPVQRLPLSPLPAQTHRLPLPAPVRTQLSGATLSHTGAWALPSQSRETGR